VAYQFDHQWKQERARLAALEAVFDPYSRRCIEGTGSLAGRRCLEVGAGGGSMAEWLCSNVGPEGLVVATDLETKFLAAIDSTNLEIREHDIVADPLESEAFDLVHSRAVLAHLPQRDQVFERLVDSLRPGGWLALVGADFSSVRAIGLPPDEASFFDSAFATVIDTARSIGFDPVYGRRLGVAFRAAGLSNVVAEGAVFEWSATHPLAQLYSMTFQRLRPLVLETGTLPSNDFAHLLALMTEARFYGISNTRFSVRGHMVAA
jgi:trans-aconitate methyltransferase